MVEIAISLGVIAFALVAIIGVLPMGMNVQRENREDTIINQDGPYFLEAIRTGAKGLDHLTNYVDSIKHIKVDTSSDPWTFPGPVDVYTNDGSGTGKEIIGYLSAPKWTNGVYRAEARVRAMSGNAIEQGTAYKDVAFSYLLQTEVVPFSAPTPSLVGVNANDLTNNLLDIRVTCRWPLLPNGDVGKNRKTFRTVASGRVVPEAALNFIEPQGFQDQP